MKEMVGGAPYPWGGYCDMICFCGWGFVGGDGGLVCFVKRREKGEGRSRGMNGKEGTLPGGLLFRFPFNGFHELGARQQQCGWAFAAEGSLAGPTLPMRANRANAWVSGSRC
jgi:hypothetical protein